VYSVLIKTTSIHYTVFAFVSSLATMNCSVMFPTIADLRLKFEHLVTSLSRPSVKSLLTSVNGAMKLKFVGGIERITTNTTTKRFQP